MSTKFYTGQKDYIAKLNDLDDVFTLAAASPDVIVAASNAAALARDVATAAAIASQASSVNADAKATAAAGSVVSAAAEKVLANTARDTATAQAVLSAGSASQALAIYGTTNAMQAALNTASAQSQLAQTAASSASSVLQQDLSAVSAALHRSPNPVTAMCLYDLSKDSDGGSWCERMQHTSWYNEALNGAWRGALASEAACRAISGAATSDYFQLTTDGKFYKLNATSGVTEVFRGNTAKFPRLAMIVAEANSVNIYDLTQPGRPMWMRFSQPTSILGSGVLAWANVSVKVSSVQALCGCIVIGGAEGFGMVLVNLTKDDLRLGWASLPYALIGRRDIASRNRTGITYTNTGDGFVLASNVVNAVAMTVLPDAPFDVATGIQIPTIAVATGGGVSVIKHDGTVVNGGVNNSSWKVSIVAFNKNNRLFAASADPEYGAMQLMSLPPYTTVSDMGTGVTGYPQIGVFNTDYGGNINFPWTLGGHNVRSVPFGPAIASNKGVTLLKEHPANMAKGIVSYVTGTYNTGYMVGGIKRAYLCNTEVGSVTGTELVANGTFDTDTSVWTKGVGWVISGGIATHNGAVGAIETSVLTVVGKVYRLSMSFPGTVVPGVIYVGSGLFYPQGLTTQSYIFMATATTTSLIIASDESNCSVDNISIKEFIQDRSYKAAGASIVGTLIKTPVAAAAQLAAFSGFGAANYIQEPYSADLDFGVGEFSLGAWVNYLPTRVNLLTKTEQFDDVAWRKQTGTTVIANNALDPIGGMTADTVSQTGAALFALSSFVATPGVICTSSVYLKANTPTKVTANYNGITNGGNNDLGVTVFELTTTWQRFAHSKAVRASDTGLFILLNGTSGQDFQIWGAQVELSTPVPTRYQRVNAATDYDGYICTISERSASAGPFIKLGLQGDRLIATASDGTTTRTVTTPLAYNTGISTKATTNYTADGKLAIRINGLEVAAVTGAPLLSLNSRYNLLTKTEDFSSVAWTKVTMATAYGAVDPNTGATATTLTATAANAAILQEVAGTSPAGSTASLWVKRRTGVGAVSMWNGSAKVAITVTTGWTEVTTAHNGTGAFYLAVYLDTLNDAIDVWRPQAKVGAVAPYQRINTAADFDYQASLTIGNSRTLDAPFPGSITLLKLGATVPTPEQALWMYEQEKQMFRPGAQVTLPEATPVFDLGYDESEDKWVAVQAGHESSFTGLIRTATATPSAGSFTKVVAGSGIKALARNATNPGVDIQIPAFGLREELVKRSEAAAKASKTLTVFDFDSVAGQTDFVLPIGWKATSVVSAGNMLREGATKNFTRLFDGFRETIRFAVAPGIAVWIRINAIKE